MELELPSEGDDGTGQPSRIPTGPPVTVPHTAPYPTLGRPDEESRLNNLLARIAAQSHFEERYQIGDELARGGMGLVLQSHDHVLKRAVALKMMLRTDRAAANEAAARGQFLKEARVGGRLLHPHILPVFDLGVNRDGLLYYSMRLVDGASLQKCLTAVETAVGTRLIGYPLRKLVTALRGVAQGIDFAHQNKVLHLDLKPANILMSGFQEVFVIDWGLARVDDVDDTDQLIDLYRRGADDEPIDDTVVPVDEVRNRRAVGTPSYMSPEQVQGDATGFGPPTDVYGLGGILYYLLYGTAPNHGSTQTDAMRASRRSKPRGTLRPGILPRGQRIKPEFRDAVAALEVITLKALEPDPDKRHSSADELVVELEEWLASAPI